jgi:Phosphodiester glycosidase
MSSEPQIPTIEHKKVLAKSFFIPLSQTSEDSSAAASHLGQFIDKSPDPISESTIVTDPFLDFLADEPTKRIGAITIAAELSAQLSLEDFADIPTYLMPAATPVPELSTQLSLEDFADIPTYLMPAATPVPELSAQLSLEDFADIPTYLMPAATPVPELSAQPTSKLPPLALLHQKHKPKQKKSHKKRLSILFLICSIITIIAVVFLGQGNGVAGAWMADNLRAFAGPTITAQIESWYLGLSNTASQLQYQFGNTQVNSPWKVGKKEPNPRLSPVPSSTPPAWSTLSPMPLTPMTPLVSPALAGEGVWSVQDNAPAPYDYLPLDAKAFIRPDPSHPYAIVTLQQFDNRFTLLHIVGGTVEPGGPRGVRGPGIIPANDVQGNTLLAAFNGGFKYSDGQYGLMTNGVVYVPPQPNAATIAITKEGKLILGLWGVDPLLDSQNTDLVAWRQNGALLINQGVINPLTHDGAAWGGTILNSVYTWRSAIGITAQGTLLYAAGNALTAETLGEALKAAGAVMAMQTDINPFWVRAFLYNRNNNGQLTISKLNPQMQGSGYEYLYGTQRDFFYLTRFAPEVPPANNQPPPLQGF